VATWAFADEEWACLRDELDEFLPARAMEHDSPMLRFRLACGECRVSARVIRLGLVTLVERSRTLAGRPRARTAIGARTGGGASTPLVPHSLL
jgi:hypothetical protein